MRHLSGWKLTLSVFAGLGLAAAFVQRPLTAPLPDTVQIADMTWIEVKTALDRGYTTVIVPSGGIEQNGAHMVLAKHDYIVRWAADRIARELGKTLVAPLVSYVPEGEYDPPSGHLRYPGTLGVSENAFALTLEGIARSLKAGGFKTICFIADHGGSQRPQAEVAARLSREWAEQGVGVISVGAYYADAAQIKLLQEQGETAATIGVHAGIIDTSELMAIHPEGVDLARIAALPFSLRSTGATGDATRASGERGRTLIEMRIAAAVREIRSSRPEPTH
jgi:creatinine amidohydrolase